MIKEGDKYMELSAGQIGSFLMYRLFNLCGDTVVKTYFAQTVPMRNFFVWGLFKELYTQIRGESEQKNCT